MTKPGGFITGVTRDLTETGSIPVVDELDIAVHDLIIHALDSALHLQAFVDSLPKKYKPTKTARLTTTPMMGPAISKNPCGEKESNWEHMTNARMIKLIRARLAEDDAQAQLAILRDHQVDWWRRVEGKHSGDRAGGNSQPLNSMA